MAEVTLAIIVVLGIFAGLIAFLKMMAKRGAGNGILSGAFFAAAFIWQKFFSIGNCIVYNPYSFLKFTNCDAGWFFLIPAIFAGAIVGSIIGLVIKVVVSDFNAQKPLEN